MVSSILKGPLTSALYVELVALPYQVITRKQRHRLFLSLLMFDRVATIHQRWTFWRMWPTAQAIMCRERPAEEQQRLQCLLALNPSTASSRYCAHPPHLPVHASPLRPQCKAVLKVRLGPLPAPSVLLHSFLTLTLSCCSLLPNRIAPSCCTTVSCCSTQKLWAQQSQESVLSCTYHHAQLLQTHWSCISCHAQL